MDLSFIVDFSLSVNDGHSEEEHFIDMRDFVVRTATIFDVAPNNTQFAYIPFSTVANDLPTQWFNNPDFQSVKSGDKPGQEKHLMSVVKPLQNDANMVGGQLIFNSKSFIRYQAYEKSSRITSPSIIYSNIQIGTSCTFVKKHHIHPHIFMTLQ